jgi:hypothetical protein
MDYSYKLVIEFHLLTHCAKSRDGEISIPIEHDQGLDAISGIALNADSRCADRDFYRGDDCF